MIENVCSEHFILTILQYKIASRKGRGKGIFLSFDGALFTLRLIIPATIRYLCFIALSSFRMILEHEEMELVIQTRSDSFLVILQFDSSV